MKQKIYKYPLKPLETQRVEMPDRAQLLHVGFQGNGLMLWAKVDPNAPMARRVIHIYGTGFEIDPMKTLFHVGTAFQDLFVWHVFDAGQE